MGVSYHLADWMTGRIWSRALPMTNVRLGGSIMGSPGGFSAELDMRTVCEPPADGMRWDPIAEAASVLGRLQSGMCSVVPIREDLSMGTMGTPQDKTMGEWLVTDTATQWSDPVVRVTGVEPSGYLQHNVVTRNWNETSADPVTTARTMISDLFSSGQTILLDTPGGSSPMRGPVEVTAGATTYWDAVRTLSTDAFEWRIGTDIKSRDVDSLQLVRALAIGWPRLVADRTEYVLEQTEDGKRPASVLDSWADDPLEAKCFDLWGFGAGSGKAQVRDRIDVARPAGMPRISRSYSNPEFGRKPSLTREMRRVMAEMDPARRPFDVIATMDVLPGGGPRPGDVYTWRRAPSLSMPTAETSWVRVLAWDWTEPQAGQIETVRLTVERTTKP